MDTVFEIACRYKYYILYVLWLCNLIQVWNIFGSGIKFISLVTL